MRGEQRWKKTDLCGVCQGPWRLGQRRGEGEGKGSPWIRCEREADRACGGVGETEEWMTQVFGLKNERRQTGGGKRAVRTQQTREPRSRAPRSSLRRKQQALETCQERRAGPEARGESDTRGREGKSGSRGEVSTDVSRLPLPTEPGPRPRPAAHRPTSQMGKPREQSSAVNTCR